MSLFTVDYDLIISAEQQCSEFLRKNHGNKSIKNALPVRMIPTPEGEESAKPLIVTTQHAYCSDG